MIGALMFLWLEADHENNNREYIRKVRFVYVANLKQVGLEN